MKRFSIVLVLLLGIVLLLPLVANANATNQKTRQIAIEKQGKDAIGAAIMDQNWQAPAGMDFVLLDQNAAANEFTITEATVTKSFTNNNVTVQDAQARLYFKGQGVLQNAAQDYLMNSAESSALPTIPAGVETIRKVSNLVSVNFTTKTNLTPTRSMAVFG